MVRSVVNGSTVVHPSCPSVLRAVHTTAPPTGRAVALGGGWGREGLLKLKWAPGAKPERLDGVRCAHSSVRALDWLRRVPGIPTLYASAAARIRLGFQGRLTTVDR